MAPKRAPKPKPKARGLRPAAAVAKPAPEQAILPEADPDTGGAEPAEAEHALSPIRTLSHGSNKSTKSPGSDPHDMEEDFQAGEEEEDEEDDDEAEGGDQGEVEDMGMEEHLALQRRVDQYVETTRHFVKFEEIECHPPVVSVQPVMMYTTALGPTTFAVRYKPIIFLIPSCASCVARLGWSMYMCFDIRTCGGSATSGGVRIAKVCGHTRAH
jgi:hypothetical protein